MKKDDLEKLLRNGDMRDMPRFKFWCVICRQFKAGSACASVEVGGWYCIWHTQVCQPLEAVGIGILACTSEFRNEVVTSE